VALSGGKTPRAVHARLVAPPVRDSIAWDRIDFFFGDERCVPPDSDRSNYRMAKETLFDPLGIDPGRVHRMRGEEKPKTAASAYAKTLGATGGAEKATAATTILTRARGYRKYTAARVRPRRGSLLWLLDEEAGARL